MNAGYQCSIQSRAIGFVRVVGPVDIARHNKTRRHRRPNLCGIVDFEQRRVFVGQIRRLGKQERATQARVGPNICVAVGAPIEPGEDHPPAQPL